MILTTLILLMFQEAELGEIWRHLGIRAISGKEVLGSKAQQSFVIFRNVFFSFFSLFLLCPHCFQLKHPTKRLFLSLYEDNKRIELPLNMCLNIFMCYNLNTHYKATQNSCRCHRLLISATQFEKTSVVSKIFISHRYGL